VLFVQANLDRDPPIYTSKCSWHDTCVEKRISLTFCSDWLGTAILPISTFQVSGMTSRSHHTQTRCVFYIYRTSQLGLAVLQDLTAIVSTMLYDIAPEFLATLGLELRHSATWDTPRTL
jgi:hypothetical protein